MKTCTKCGIEKAKSEFYKNARTKDELQRICKGCDHAKNKLWQENNRDKTRAIVQRWRENNREASRKNKREYRKIHKDKVAESCKLRKDRLKQSTPEWANMFFIEEAYELARIRTKLHGFKWEIDHIIPIAGWVNGVHIVCGLHVENNLQVIPELENKLKGYWIWPNMP